MSVCVRIYVCLCHLCPSQKGPIKVSPITHQGECIYIKHPHIIYINSVSSISLNHCCKKHTIINCELYEPVTDKFPLK